MPRGPGGGYDFPLGSGNPVIPDTIIETDWANPTLEDIKAALTDSLSRNGYGGMLAPLHGPDGEAPAPSFSFTNATGTGFWREPTGAMRSQVDGNNVLKWDINGLYQWDKDILDWVPLTPRDAWGTPFDPDRTSLTKDNVQEAIEEVYAAIGGDGSLHARDIEFDDTAEGIYFGAPTVQLAIQELAGDVSLNVNDILYLAGEVARIEGEVDILDQAVRDMADDVNKNEADIGVINTWITNHEQDYTDLLARVNQHDLDLQFLYSEIQKNDLDIGNIFTRLDQAETDIQNNETQIAANLISINSLDNRVGTIESLFPGGVLQVQYGGTGVTTKQGTGSVVLNNNPTILSPYISGGTIENINLNNVTGGGSIWLGNNATSQTKDAGDNDDSVATTAFVHSLLASTGNLNLIHSSNGNGSRMLLRNGLTNEFMIQWGNALYGAVSNQYVPFGYTFMDSGNVRVFMQNFSNTAGEPGLNYAPVVRSITASGFNYSSPYNAIWMAIGRNS